MAIIKSDDNGYALEAAAPNVEARSAHDTTSNCMRRSYIPYSENETWEPGLNDRTQGKKHTCVREIRSIVYELNDAHGVKRRLKIRNLKSWGPSTVSGKMSGPVLQYPTYI
jgi:hypothetical protein